MLLAEFAPAWMIVCPEPAPWIFTGSVMSRSPVADAFSSLPAIFSVYVPAGIEMVSAPVLLLAAMVASRRLQSESQMPSFVSAVLVTVNVWLPAA